MAGIEISQLPLTLAATLTDIFPIVQGGVTSQLTLTQLKTLYLGGLTDGQLLIGSTGLFPVASTITAGAGISIANGAGSITISSSGGGVAWTEVTAATQTIAINNGYVSNRGGGVVYTLPLVSALGDIFSIAGKAGQWQIAQLAGQSIQVGNLTSSVGIGGTVTSTDATDSATFVCITANLKWATLCSPQSAGLTIV